MDYGQAGAAKPVLTMLCVLTNQKSTNCFGTGGYPNTPVCADTNVGTINYGPAILTIDLGSLALVDVDVLNANNAQPQGPLAGSNGIPRGLVRTGLSVPSVAVVSEATNIGTNGSGYCATNGGTCNALTVGDPLQTGAGLLPQLNTGAAQAQML